MAAHPRLLREDDLREILVEKGIRVTEQRMIVLRELAKLRVPVSHPELTARLDASTLDRATVYRTLLTLTEAGLLVKTQLGDGVWRFGFPATAKAEHGEHPHFVCNDCGSVQCLPTNAVSLTGAATKNRVAEVQLRGLCSGCARS